MSFQEAIEDAVEESDDRNFTESIDIVVNLKEIDLSDPNNRISEDLKLPYQADDDIKIAVIGDTLAKNGEDAADKTITEDELEEYYEEPNKAKKLADEYDFLIAEAPLMPDIGQHLGQVFGPRDMMPDPMPPGSDPTDEIQSLRSTVSLRLKEQPLVQLKVGNEEQDTNQIGRNAETVYNFIRDNLPEGDNNIKSVLVKTTMGSPVEVDN